MYRICKQWNVAAQRHYASEFLNFFVSLDNDATEQKEEEDQSGARTISSSLFSRIIIISLSKSSMVSFGIFET